MVTHLSASAQHMRSMHQSKIHFSRRSRRRSHCEGRRAVILRLQLVATSVAHQPWTWVSKLLDGYLLDSQPLDPRGRELYVNILAGKALSREASHQSMRPFQANHVWDVREHIPRIPIAQLPTFNTPPQRLDTISPPAFRWFCCLMENSKWATRGLKSLIAPSSRLYAPVLPWGWKDGDLMSKVDRPRGRER